MMSPERYMRERVRNLPIGKCYINPDWEEDGLAHIIVTRERAGGKLVYGSFLVDTLCLGIKDAEYAIDFTPMELEDALAHFRKNHELEEIDYDKIHNLIYGAIEFAEEGGISPVKEFTTASYILSEDTDDIPLIEYEYGKEGKHVLVIGPDGREEKYLKTLFDHLGDKDQIVWMDMRMAEDEDDTEGIRDLVEEKERHYTAIYDYQHPEYPKEPMVKNQFIADALLDPKYYEELPREIIKRIYSLPDDEAAEDISNVALYTIGNTYKRIDDGQLSEPEEGALVHTAILLTGLASEKGLPALLEILRQSPQFIEFHYGDLAEYLLPMAVYSTMGDNAAEVESMFYQPGLDSYHLSLASESLVIRALLEPERREEVVEIYRRLLTAMKERLPERKDYDATFAGFVMSHLIDMEAKELIEEVREVFATDCVDKSIAGDCEEVIEQIKHNAYPRQYEIPTIHEMYENVKSFA